MLSDCHADAKVLWVVLGGHLQVEGTLCQYHIPEGASNESALCSLRTAVFDFKGEDLQYFYSSLS